MPSFSQIQKGTRARKPIPFPTANTRCDLLADLPELAAQRTRDQEAWEKASQAGSAPPGAPDDHILVDLRVLTGAEESLVLQKAREHALEHGVSDPKDGEPLYEVGKMVWSLSLGILDHDSPENDPKLFFDGGAKQILDEVDGDLIAFLFTRWEIWQGECSHQLGSLSGPQFWEQIVKVTVSNDDLPFSQMRRTAQWVLLRTMGALWLNSPEAKSHFISAFEGTPKTGSTKPAPGPMKKSKGHSKGRR